MRTSVGRARQRVLLAALCCWPAATVAEIAISEGTNLSADVTPTGTHVIDLIGGLWLVPSDGGTAERLPNDLHPARDPSISKNGRQIVYVAESGQSTELWIYDVDERATHTLATQFGSYEHPEWHPRDERIAFAADRDGTGFAIYEVDVPTGLTWRVTHGDGDSLWPAWSDDGRDLAYVRRFEDRHELVLRRLGQPEEILLVAEEALSAPSFRPDKSLVTVTRHAADGLRIDMVILSTPRLVRTLIEDDDIFISRPAWRDKQRIVYTANGRIRERDFNAFSSTNVEFVARIEPPELAPAGAALGRRLEPLGEPARDIVIRASRLYDGLDGRYRQNVDIVISDGIVVALEPVTPRTGQTLIDLGDITVMPGLIDILAEPPSELSDRDGARYLSFGVTMLVTNRPDADSLDARWSRAESPGPRVLRAAPLAADVEPAPWLFILDGDRSTGEAQKGLARRWQAAGVPVLAGNWQVGLGAGASLVLGGKTLPVSPMGRRYADLRVTNGQSAVTVVSSLAHQGTPGLDALYDARQAAGLPRRSARRLASPTTLAPGQSQVVLGSARNGLPPGIAQQAELRALVDAGMSPHDALKSASVNAALALGLGLRAGRIAPGAQANLVLVAGDPLHRIEDAAGIVGVVQNGRFMSLGRLMDRIALP